MAEPTMPIGDIIDTWSDTEKEVWSAWSKLEQDLSRSESHDRGQLLDAIDSSAQQMARIQSAALRAACDSVIANPLLPPHVRTLAQQASGPLLGLAGCQQHLISAWLGMARHMAVSVPIRGAHA